MAIRYSGTFKIAVTLCDDDTFRARISEDGAHVGTCSGLRLAPTFTWTRSFDCPEAFDEMARAALSFLSAGYGDGSPDGGGPEIELNGAEYNDSGYVVTRRQPAWA